MLLIVYGTRPEYLKLKPLIKLLKTNVLPYRLLFTGQHLNIAEPLEYDYTLSIADGGNRLDSIMASICSTAMDAIVLNASPDYVMVQGDTTTAAAAAISAFNHNVPVIHLEAGLRTYDNANPYPEEINRRLISQIAEVHLCPTEVARNNLINERVAGVVEVTGNTALDNLINLRCNVAYGTEVLVTLHRRENLPMMPDWFKAVDSLASSRPDLTFILPLHPNPAVRQHLHHAPHINIVQPMEHAALLDVLCRCSMVITDSGGLQEECSFLNKKCLVCRKVTERPEALGLSSFMVTDPSNLKNIFDKHIAAPAIDETCPFGDGYASQRVYEVLLKVSRS